MTSEVIEAVCQCLLAAAVDTGDGDAAAEAPQLDGADRDPVRDVIEEFARCLQDIISASHQAQPLTLFDEVYLITTSSNNHFCKPVVSTVKILGSIHGLYNLGK